MSNRIGNLPADALNGGSANGYGAKFNLRMAKGTVYRAIILSLTALTIAQVPRISLTLNGDEIYRVSGTDLDKLRKAQGLHTNASTIVIPFCDMSQRTIGSQNLSELIVGANENLVLKVDTADATQAQLDANAVAVIDVRFEFSTMPRPQGRVYLPRMFTESLNGNRTGDNRYTGLLTQNKSGNESRLQRLILKSDKVVNLKLYRNKIKTFDKSRDNNGFDLASLGVTQQAAEFHYSAVSHGYSEIDALTVVNDFEVVANLSGAGNFDALYQTIEKVA